MLAASLFAPMDYGRSELATVGSTKLWRRSLLHLRQLNLPKLASIASARFPAKADKCGATETQLRALSKRVGSVVRCSVWRDRSCGRFTDQELKRGDQE